MLETIQYQQLNEDAKKYLLQVRQSNGVGSPGIFVKQSYNRPAWALVLGLSIIPFTLIWAYNVPKAPGATAALQTAGLLLGGWLILYAFRRWLASPNVFGGKFLYFDPDHVYVGEGENLKLAYLGEDPEVEPFGQNQVRFATEDSQFAVTVPSQFTAQLVSDYYQALNWVRTRQEGKWADLPLAEAGAVAKYLAELDEEPPSVAETNLTIEELPEEVRAEGRAKSGALMLLLIVGAGVGLFAFFSATNAPIQDAIAFSDAEKGGATGMRDYLLNDRNTRYRDQVTTKLKKLYDAPIAQVQGVQEPPAGKGDKELKGGMVKLLESLSGPEIPAISIRVTDKTTVPTESATLRTRFADGLGQSLAGPNRDLIVAVQAPDDKKALLEVEYSRTQAGIINWKVEIRLKPDEAPVAAKSGSLAERGAVIQPNGQLGSDIGEQVYADIMERMIGVAPPPAPPLPVEDF
jgi:hypothetical protein